MGICAVKVDESLSRFPSAAGTVFDKGDTSFAMSVMCFEKRLDQEFLSFGRVFQKADDEVEFGFKPTKVAPVFFGVDVVFFKFGKSRGWIGYGIAIERDGIRANTISFFIGVCKKRPVNVFVKIFAEFYEVFGGQASAWMDVEFTSFG